MEQDTARKSWAPPKLEQIPMVNTAVKGTAQSEDINLNMFMTATGMAS